MPTFWILPQSKSFPAIFGLEFHHDGHTYVCAISTYDFAHCFNLIDKLQYPMSHKRYKFGLNAGIPAVHPLALWAHSFTSHVSLQFEQQDPFAQSVCSTRSNNSDLSQWCHLHLSSLQGLMDTGLCQWHQVVRGTRPCVEPFYNHQPDPIQGPSQLLCTVAPNSHLSWGWYAHFTQTYQLNIFFYMFAVGSCQAHQYHLCCLPYQSHWWESECIPDPSLPLTMVLLTRNVRLCETHVSGVSWFCAGWSYVQQLIWTSVQFSNLGALPGHVFWRLLCW